MRTAFERFSVVGFFADVNEPGATWMVDAWGKAVTMLGVPQRAAWERLPGVTDTDIQRWAEMPAQLDSHGLLADLLARAADPTIERVNLDQDRRAGARTVLRRSARTPLSFKARMISGRSAGEVPRNAITRPSTRPVTIQRVTSVPTVPTVSTVPRLDHMVTSHQQ